MVNFPKTILRRGYAWMQFGVIAFVCICLFSWIPNDAESQQLESLHVNLYTDSLKRGTWNYINIDGYFSNQRYLPLDSQWLSYRTDVGHFDGNKLWLPDTTNAREVHIEVRTRKAPELEQAFVVAIKQLPDPPLTIREDDILANPPTRKRKRN